ncbi:type II toxin-antitoxin system MqsA family antitoxin [Rhodosalinus halophilus]|uniref:type II toxin-antitoxin system MqsA family antitoxin n=1 Tax=Rhodosalinus halophilus TaxID=2259333 RepID=UPI0018F51E04|nr:type II toxin-antitoxin system MqsA family antitoxin [Rhodosalinus halophilus]
MRSSEALVQDETETIGCELCGAAALEASRVQLALWEEERLVVVEDVPALVCRGCGERFYDDETAMRLDMLRGTGFPPGRAASEMAVEVFRLPDLGPRRDG